MRRLVMMAILLLGLFVQTTYAAESETKVRTAGGVLEVVPVRDEQWVVLGGRQIIRKHPESIVRFERVWDRGSSTVCLVSADMGGSGTIPSYYFVEVFGDGRYLFSEEFDSSDYTFKTADDPQTHRITIDLGYESGRHKYAVYSDHKLRIQFLRPKRTDRTEDDCNYLYNSIYLPYAEAHRCDEDPIEIGGMSTARSVYAMQNNPNLKTDRLAPLAKEACTSGRTLRYSAFRREVCP
jgi:hypothetical protein